MDRLKRSIVLLFIASAALALVPVARAGALKQDEVDKIVAAGKAEAESRVMEHLDILSNRIGPRLTSSDNLRNACEWARDRFASYGLEATIEPWGEFPVGFNRGPWFGRVVEPEGKALQFITASWSAGTQGVVRGKAVLAPINDEEFAKVKDRVKGAWVVSPTATRDRRPTPEFARGLAKRLEEAGAAGIVKPAWVNDLIITDGNQRVSWDALPTMPTVRLVKKQFDEVAGWLKEDKPVVLEFDIRNYFKKGPITLSNVVADLKGTDKADEYVILGGHIDSWDGATGATDNGTGVATTIEAARILMKAGVKPRRTIRFMLWSGEEQGLLGSRAYVKAHPELMPKISAVLVHDMGTNYLSSLAGTEAMQSDLRTALAPLVGLDARYPFEVRKVNGLSGGGSDHASFLSANVPGLFWGQSGKAVYNKTHHTQFDTYDAVVPEYQRHSALVAALGAYGIADLDNPLSREKLRAPGMQAGNRRLLGIQLEELNVVEVMDDGVAAKAGMRDGDIIIKIDGAKLVDRLELTTAIQKGERKKTIVVLRDGKEIELTVEWPAASKKANDAEKK